MENPTKLMSLPNEWITLILLSLPLSSLIHLRRVCQRFSSIIPLVCKSKHRLKLVLSAEQQSACSHYSSRDLFAARPAQGYNNDEVISVSSLSQYNNVDISNYITTLLPNVRHLVAFTYNENINVDMASTLYHHHLPVELIPRWSSTLVSLTLIGNSEMRNDSSEDIFRQTCQCTNSLVSLRELHLLWASWPIAAESMSAVLGRLEAFTLHGYGGEVGLVVRWFGTQIRLLYLNVHRTFNEPARLELTEDNRHLEHCLTHLSLDTNFVHTSTVANLHALTFLDLTNVTPYICTDTSPKMFNTDLFVALSRLPRLKELRLSMQILSSYFCEANFRFPYRHIASSNIGQVAQLRSVVSLHIRGYETDFDKFSVWFKALAHMFSLVTSIVVIKHCSKDEGLPRAEIAQQFIKQMHEYIRPFFVDISLKIHFELNRHVLGYYRPNEDSYDIREKLIKFFENVYEFPTDL